MVINNQIIGRLRVPYKALKDRGTVDSISGDHHALNLRVQFTRY
jgi:hypothetical protein